MDPLTAFGLAVNVLTVVDLSIKVISKAGEIRSAEYDVDYSELVTKDLKSCCLKLTEKNLSQLALEATKIADEISRNFTRATPNVSVLKSLGAAVKEIWGAAKYEEKTKRLEAIRNELQFHVLVQIKAQVDVIALGEGSDLQSLDEHTRRMIEAVLSGNDAIRRELDKHTEMSNMGHEETHAVLQTLHLDHSSQAEHYHHEQMNALRNLAPHVHITQDVDFPAITQKLLGSLAFRQMYDRFDVIKEAHRHTFEWIFSSANNNGGSSCTFMDWMKGENGVYWVSGKAGGGKSTLMKFLRKDERFKSAFKAWANGQTLVTTSFWFWEQGQDSKQQSLQGLLQALFHGIIKQEPEYGPLLFPDQFVAGVVDWQGFPTSRELQRAFERLVSAENPPAHVGILIDGLDEFSAPEGEQYDLAQQLKSAAHAKHLKIIVSSRPEDAFETAFKDCAKLRLHELTFEDQKRYVSDRLRSQESLEYLRGQTEDWANVEDQLIATIVKNSEGIFLWTRLLIEMLEREMRQCHDLTRLRTLLNEFPSGLEKLFVSMLRRIPEERRKRGYRLIQLVRRGTELFDLQSRCITTASLTMTAMLLSVAQDDIAKVIKKTDGRPPPEEGHQILLQVGNELRMNCAGLLELNDQPIAEASEDYGDWDLEVKFVHRSVSEWLSHDQYSVLFDATEDINSEVDLTLTKGILRKIKSADAMWPAKLRGQDQGSLFVEPRAVLELRHWDYLDQFMRLSWLNESTYPRETTEMLDELDRSMTAKKQLVDGNIPRLSEKERDHFRNSSWTYFHPWITGFNKLLLRDPYQRESFLSFTIICSLEDYPTTRLRSLPQSTLANIGPMLFSDDHVKDLRWYPSFGMIRAGVVKELLKLGLSPNQDCKNLPKGASTPWKFFWLMLDNVCIVNLSGAKQLSETIEAFLGKGADPSIEIPSSGGQILPTVRIREMFIQPTLQVHYILHGRWTPPAVALTPCNSEDALPRSELYLPGYMHDFARKRPATKEFRDGVAKIGHDLLELLQRKQDEQRRKKGAHGLFLKLRKKVAQKR